MQKAHLTPLVRNKQKLRLPSPSPSTHKKQIRVMPAVSGHYLISTIAPDRPSIAYSSSFPPPRELSQGISLDSPIMISKVSDVVSHLSQRSRYSHSSVVAAFNAFLGLDHISSRSDLQLKRSISTDKNVQHDERHIDN